MVVTLLSWTISFKMNIKASLKFHVFSIGQIWDLLENMNMYGSIERILLRSAVAYSI